MTVVVSSMMEPIRPNKGPLLPLSLSCLIAILVIDNSQTILFALRPASLILAASYKLEFSITLLLTLLVPSRVQLPIFPCECTISLVSAIAPLAFIVVLDIKGGEFNFAIALWSQDTPVYLTFIDSSVSVVNFCLSFVEVYKFYFIYVSIL